MGVDSNQAKSIFLSTVEDHAPDQWGAYLDEACQGDAPLRQRVEVLLAAHQGKDKLLDDPQAVLLGPAGIAEPMEAVGTTIGRYKLLEKIGEGGMAVVYMAEQTEPIRRKVALKIIKLGMDTRQVIARFEAERQALALMDHPSIAKVLDAGATETGRPYFVMELVQGISITEYCDKNSLSTKDRLALFLQVCHAVQHAHQKGIIHRDIKPSNVMVTHHDGQPIPKVIDFGIAKATNQKLTEKTIFTRYAHLIGTPAYMSPEQAELSDLDIDTRSDIYSLGVLLYELLTGTTPFSEEELRKAGYLEMQRVIREQEPVKPSTKLSTLGETLTDIAKHRSSTPDVLRKAVRGDLDWIVMKSLEKDRLRRYEAAEGLARDIQRHLEHRPVLARAPSKTYRLHKFLRRHRSEAAVALAVGVVVGTVVVLSVWNRHQVRLAEAEGVRIVNIVDEARKLIAKGDLAAARQALRPILDSRLAGGLEARILFATTLAPGQEPDASTSGTETIMARHYRERVRYYSERIRAHPADPENYLQRAQQYHCLHEEGNVHADMSRYAALVTRGRFAAFQFGTPTRVRPVISSSSRYRLVLSVAGRENGVVVMSIAFGQKGRSNMKPFEIPMFLASLFGGCFLAGLDTPTVLADFTFETPQMLGPTINGPGSSELVSCLSSDGLELYFDWRTPERGHWSIYVSRRATVDADWGAPENLGSPINTPDRNDAGASISADGLTLYFCSERAGGSGSADIWVTTRATKEAPWGSPANLGPKVNSSAWDGYCSISADGLELYLVSYRSGGYGNGDIWVARRATDDAPWTEPVNLGPTVNSTYYENCPGISADGRLLFFSEHQLTPFRPDGLGAGDLWVSVRRTTSDSWGPPVNLGPTINGPCTDMSPRLSHDARTLYFSSWNRPGNPGLWDIMQASILPVVDFNGDGKVDAKDLAILSDNWGSNVTLCDVGPFAWGDGTVDARDLTVLGEYMDVRGPVVAHSPLSHAVEVSRDVILRWTPGDFAQTHDVYFGTSLESVTSAERAKPLGVLVSQGQDANSYDTPGPLEFGRTYYWRVDEVGAAPGFKTYRGFVWSLTTESLSYPIKTVTATASSALPQNGPENTVNGSGLDANDLHSAENKDMWLSAAEGPKPAWIQFEFDKVYKLDQMLVWNYNVMFEPVLGYGLKGVTVAYSKDGSAWTTLGDFELARGTGKAGYAGNTTVNFAGAAGKYVKITARSNWGGLSPAQYGLSEVRFLCFPAQATEPQPANGQTGVSPDAGLSWTAGRGTVLHQVYLSTDTAAVANGTALAGTVGEAGFDPGPLSLGRTYYWKVNEVNQAEAISVWEGDLWSFSTQEYVAVDDFEGCNDDEGKGTRIYETWIDGYTNKLSGSTVGHIDAPFAERTIVHGGRQSMPVEYNNAVAPFYSEIERTFDTPQDWTAHGADTLALYFQGRAASFLERSPGTIVLSGGGTDIYNTADQFRFASRQLTGNGAIVARVDKIANTDLSAKCGVMIRESLDPGSRFAAVYATPGHGVRFQARLLNAGAATSDSSVATAEQTALNIPVWVKLERSGNSFSGFYSTDGTKWVAMSWNPQTITMASAVYVGLAATSHNADLMTTAEFSGVSVTGAVTGSWEVASVGVAQPTNDPAPLYVVVQDSLGKSKLVAHPDPGATTVASWQPWCIGLSEFTAAGLRMKSVKKLILGVGDRNKPAAGGQGVIYVDDIGFGHPAP